MTVGDEIRFFLDHEGETSGPLSDDDVRDALRDGKVDESTRARLDGSDVWAPVRAWATLSARRSLVGIPAAPAKIGERPPAALASASDDVKAMLLWFVHENARVAGPFTGEQLRVAVEQGKHAGAAIALAETAAWFPIATVFATEDIAPTTARTGQLSSIARSSPSISPEAEPSFATPAIISTSFRCVVCLEKVTGSVEICPECGEPAIASPASQGPASIPDVQPGASWISMHWRPIVILGAILSLFCFGVTLRYLAPNLAEPAAQTQKPAAAPAAPCPTACWSGEACVNAHCVWQKPNTVGHVAADSVPTVGGSFALPKDVTDALPLDSERFAVSLLAGLQIRNTRTGEILGLVNDAPQSRRLYRIGGVVYATAPQRIYVVDAQNTRILKTIEIGAQVGDVVIGASGRRALASLPNAHAVAILATEYHAEIDRIQFGDDPVGPMGVDDTGTRALTTTGQIPLAGLRDPQGGAVYAFDPSRLASAQDRVRAAMLGNPVSVLMTPTGEESYVVLRAEDKLVPLDWLPSGAVRQHDAIPTCREPEQVELDRRERRAIVRCNEGRALEIVDLRKREVIRDVPLNGRATDLAVSPDGEQAIVTLPGESSGFVALVDLETFVVRMVPLDAEPTRVRLSPDGRTALVLSDRAKTSWVIR